VWEVIFLNFWKRADGCNTACWYEFPWFTWIDALFPAICRFSYSCDTLSCNQNYPLNTFAWLHVRGYVTTYVILISLLWFLNLGVAPSCCFCYLTTAAEILFTYLSGLHLSWEPTNEVVSFIYWLVATWRFRSRSRLIRCFKTNQSTSYIRVGWGSDFGTQLYL